MVLKRENRRWGIDDVVHISETCIILHNMIITAVDNGEIDSVHGVNLATEFHESENQIDDSYSTDVEGTERVCSTRS